MPQTSDFQTAYWILPNGDKVMPFDIAPYRSGYPLFGAFCDGVILIDTPIETGGGTGVGNSGSEVSSGGTGKPVETAYIPEEWSDAFFLIAQERIRPEDPNFETICRTYYASVGSPSPETSEFEQHLQTFKSEFWLYYLANPVKVEKEGIASEDVG